MKSRNRQRNQVFLFINKDSKSKSLSKSEGTAAKEINRHAQQVSNSRLAQHKVSTAHHSSSSARRIALDGWNRRDHDVDNLFESDPPTPVTTDFCSNVSLVDHGSAEVTPVGSNDQSSASSSPPASSPEGREGLDGVELSPSGSPPSLEQPGDSEEQSPITPATPRNLFSPGDGVDPFGVLPIRLNEHLHAALQTAFQIYPYSGNNYKLAYIPKHMRGGMNKFPINQVVRQSVYQEHHLYSLLATISARMASIMRRPMSGMTPAMYRAKSAHHLRVELGRNAQTGDIDKHTILDILYLAVSEIVHKDLDAATKHLIVVGKLYHILDISEHFDFWISETAAHVDNQLALATGKRPVLPYTFDPGPLLPERMAALRRELQSLINRDLAAVYEAPSPLALAVSSSPHGFKDAIADLASTLDLRMGSKFEYGLKVGVFNAWMSRIVKDLVDCVAIAKVVWLSPHAVCYDAEWLCRKARAIMRALLAAAPESNIGPPDLLSKCMETARISLLIMMSHACTLLGFQTAKANVARLQKSMGFALEHWAPVVGLTNECEAIPGRELDGFARIELQFIVFSVMVGVWSAAESPTVEQWFLVRAVNICHILGIRSYCDLQEHLVSFLLSKTLQDASIRKVAALLEGD